MRSTSAVVMYVIVSVSVFLSWSCLSPLTRAPPDAAHINFNKLLPSDTGSLLYNSQPFWSVEKKKTSTSLAKRRSGKGMGASGGGGGGL